MAAGLAIALTGCGGGAVSARLDKTGVLPFENLSGDPSLDRWRKPLQHAFQAMSGAGISVASKEDAILGGTSVIAHGLMERIPATNQVQLTLELYDVATQKLLQSASASDTEPIAAVTKLAKLIEPKATAWTGVSVPGISLWSEVLNAANPAQLADGCRKLLESEPAFGPGYVACINAPLTAVDRLAAAERGFTNRQKFRAEDQMAVGQMLFQSGKFQQAAEALTALAPSMPSAWNTVGYSQAMLGNLPAAKKALEEYRKFGGDEPNAVDSLGETHYFTGKYAEAEKYFLEVGEKFPQTQQGRVAHLKAACMRVLQGNRGGAEELVQSLIANLKKNNQNAKPLEELWRTIILEQDQKQVREKIEASGIILRPGRSVTAP